MNVAEIRERAVALGLAGVSKQRKADLIRSIQQAEGNSTCYGADWRRECAETACCWREDCQKE